MVPFLKEKQFDYTPKTRTFRKSDSGYGCTLIIDFQVGQRSMKGRFTVNLSVFYPELYHETEQELPPEWPREFHCLPRYRERLGALHDTPFTTLFKRFVKGSNHCFSQWLISPPDRWWKFSDKELVTRISLEQVVKDLKEYGFSWFKEKTDFINSLNKKKEQ